MQSFSQRIGLKPIRTVIQRESADEALRNSLWNVLHVNYFNRIKNSIYDTDEYINNLLTRIWIYHYGNRIDERSKFNSEILTQIKVDFLASSWNEMFDILQFIPNNYIEKDNFINQTNIRFVSFANEMLKQHLSAYRFINYLITEISSDEEITSIEEALNVTSKYRAVQEHLTRALEMFSDRKNPDYRNSIKESISAIESFCCIITKNPKATLGQALKEIENKHELHPALKSSFSSLYGYTSESDGIRHGLLTESTLKQEDAKFMLVACSAFVNYLLVKTS